MTRRHEGKLGNKWPSQEQSECRDGETGSEQSDKHHSEGVLEGRLGLLSDQHGALETRGSLRDLLDCSANIDCA